VTLRVASAPSQGLIVLDEAKAQCRVDDEDEDVLIGGLILTATAMVEAATQRRYVTQTLEWVIPYWRRCIRLPVAPVAADGVLKIEYVDANGALQEMSPSLYVVAPDGDTVSIRARSNMTWPFLDEDAAEPVKITFRAGSAPDAVSPLAKHAALLIIDHLFENRAAVTVAERTLSVAELPLGVDALLLPERWL
jgi:uncharacterized phiE125 gp8 family phage protein